MLLSLFGLLLRAVGGIFLRHFRVPSEPPFHGKEEFRSSQGKAGEVGSGDLRHLQLVERSHAASCSVGQIRGRWVVHDAHSSHYPA